MTAKSGLATFATAPFTLETLKINPETERKATEVVRSWLPDTEADDVLTMLGITDTRNTQ